MDDDAVMIDFYRDRYDESARLHRAAGRLELMRTQQIVRGRLTGDGLRIADVGGGPGVYAAWLAGLGHHVVIVDPVERHVDQARQLDPGLGSVDARVGDARALDLPDDSVDALLLLGPLYHLLDAVDRRTALVEAQRVLRPGGPLFAAGISRHASVHDGLVNRWLLDEEFAAIAYTDLLTGRHENREHRNGWFTNSYFHRPDDLFDEVVAAGFVDVEIVGLEGIAGWFPDLDDRLDDPAERTTILDALRRMQAEPSLLGASAHLLAIGQAPN